MTRNKKQSEHAVEPDWAAADPPASASTAEEHIRRRAYEIYRERERLGVPGDAVADWLRAEQELRQKEDGRPGWRNR